MLECLFSKETSTQAFSSEYCEVYKNTYFEGHLLTAAPTNRVLHETNVLRNVIQILYFLHINLSNLSFNILGSSRPGVLCEKGILKNLAIFTGKHGFQACSFNKQDSNTIVLLWILRNSRTSTNGWSCILLYVSLLYFLWEARDFFFINLFQNNRTWKLTANQLFLHFFPKI